MSSSKGNEDSDNERGMIVLLKEKVKGAEDAFITIYKSVNNENKGMLLYVGYEHWLTPSFVNWHPRFIGSFGIREDTYYHIKVQHFNLESLKSTFFVPVDHIRLFLIVCLKAATPLNFDIGSNSIVLRVHFSYPIGRLRNGGGTSYTARIIVSSAGRHIITIYPDFCSPNCPHTHGARNENFSDFKDWVSPTMVGLNRLNIFQPVDPNGIKILQNHCRVTNSKDSKSMSIRLARNMGNKETDGFMQSSHSGFDQKKIDRRKNGKDADHLRSRKRSVTIGDDHEEMINLSEIQLIELTGHTNNVDQSADVNTNKVSTSIILPQLISSSFYALLTVAENWIPKGILELGKGSQFYNLALDINSFLLMFVSAVRITIYYKYDLMIQKLIRHFLCCYRREKSYHFTNSSLSNV